ncbi:MAG: type II toxin-antitoxin system PemK/MazF family toxin [Rhodobacteraceae bacterium]|nr:type II toxin-antitoxin system PemK/MazF family toxin [Paracoccaceae bacterium]
MPTSDAPVGAVVRVPFPYTDGAAQQHRPALVVAAAGPAPAAPLLWVLMITSAANRGWPGDLDIPDPRAAGLPAPSVIRTAKIATIDAARAEPRGSVDPATIAAARACVRERLDLPADLRPERPEV